jgi:hypothetical protein
MVASSGRVFCRTSPLIRGTRGELHPGFEWRWGKGTGSHGRPEPGQERAKVYRTFPEWLMKNGG